MKTTTPKNAKVMEALRLIRRLQAELDDATTLQPSEVIAIDNVYYELLAILPRHDQEELREG